MGGAYYNENDPFAAAWLRNLVSEAHIAPGEVDERKIEQVCAEDLRGFTQHHFFAGIGVWSYALGAAGWPDGAPVWTGSCPCQGFSASGKRAGFGDSRHLWPAWFRLIRELRPVTIFGEQVASRDGLAWFDVVSADLEGEGYAVGAVDTCAAGFGAPHIRQRLYFVANSKGAERQGFGAIAHRQQGGLANAGEAGSVNGFWRDAEWLPCRDGKLRSVEPSTFPLAHGIANRVGLLRGYGNALVGPQAEAFVRAYMGLRHGVGCGDQS